MKKITLLLAAGLFSFGVSAQSPEVQSLLDRATSVADTYTGSFSSLFTSSEMTLLNEYYAELDTNQPQLDQRAPGVFGYGWESQGNGTGSYELDDPANYTFLNGGSGSADFEAAGSIDPSNPDTGHVMDNAGLLWEFDVEDGAYEFLGTVLFGGQALANVTGLHYSADGGELYAITTTELYEIDVDDLEADFIGTLGTTGGVAIALAIDSDDVGYTYDITDDSFYSIDLTDGTATLVGPLGFDAGFGQGMGYDPNTDAVYMASFTDVVNISELRIVDVTDGSSTVVGETFPGAVTQVAWFSIPTGQLSISDVNATSLISVSPNPADNAITLTSDRALDIETVTMYNIVGQRAQVQLSNNTVDISSLAGGIYLLEVTLSNGDKGTFKVVKR